MPENKRIAASKNVNFFVEKNLVFVQKMNKISMKKRIFGALFK